VAESLCHVAWLADAEGCTAYFNELGTPRSADREHNEHNRGYATHSSRG
jgi:hypothetical protein